MRSDNTVTIWHFENSSDKPVRKVFDKAYVDAVNKISKNGIKQMGFFNASGAVVRIPTSEILDISPGDYLALNEMKSELPPEDVGIKIIEVKDNRRGGQKHWRILCGG